MKDLKNYETLCDVIKFHEGPSVDYIDKVMYVSNLYNSPDIQREILNNSANANTGENKPLGGRITSSITDNDDYNSENDSTEKFTEVENYEQEHFMDSFRWHHICSIIIFLLFITFGIYLYCNA